MATTHNTPNYVETDTRPSWPKPYSVITGMVILMCGAFSLKGLPIIPIIMLTLAVLVLWGLRRYGTWKNKKLLKHLPTWYAWKTAIVVLVIGLVGLLFGSIEVTVLEAFGFLGIGLIMLAVAVLILWGLRRYGTWKNKDLLKRLPIGKILKIGIILLIGVFLCMIMSAALYDVLKALALFGTILIFLISVMATVGLLLAVSYHARKMRVVSIVCLLIVSMFLPQFGAGVSQTPAEKTREVCAGPDAALFPNECP